jgi:hypothetical protein
MKHAPLGCTAFGLAAISSLDPVGAHHPILPSYQCPPVVFSFACDTSIATERAENVPTMYLDQIDNAPKTRQDLARTANLTHLWNRYWAVLACQRNQIGFINSLLTSITPCAILVLTMLQGIIVSTYRLVAPPLTLVVLAQRVFTQRVVVLGPKNAKGSRQVGV